MTLEPGAQRAPLCLLSHVDWVCSFVLAAAQCCTPKGSAADMYTYSTAPVTGLTAKTTDLELVSLPRSLSLQLAALLVQLALLCLEGLHLVCQLRAGSLQFLQSTSGLQVGRPHGCTSRVQLRKWLCSSSCNALSDSLISASREYSWHAARKGLVQSRVKLIRQAEHGALLAVLGVQAWQRACMSAVCWLLIILAASAAACSFCTCCRAACSSPCSLLAVSVASCIRQLC